MQNTKNYHKIMTLKIGLHHALFSLQQYLVFRETSMHLTDLLILVSQSCYCHNFEGAHIHVLNNFLTVSPLNSVENQLSLRRDNV